MSPLTAGILKKILETVDDDQELVQYDASCDAYRKIYSAYSVVVVDAPWGTNYPDLPSYKSDVKRGNKLVFNISSGG